MDVLEAGILSKAVSSPGSDLPPGCTGFRATFGTRYRFATQKRLCGYGETAVSQMNNRRIHPIWNRADFRFQHGGCAGLAQLPGVKGWV